MTASGLAHFESVDQAVAALAPDLPLHCLRPQALSAMAGRFVTGFSGRVVYAMKCNPHPVVLQSLAAAGVSDFDAASLSEIARLAQVLPRARAHFMNPIKPRRAIATSYRDFGVRTFVLDSHAELAKIVQATDAAPDLTLIVRLRTAETHSAWPMSEKFGATTDEAASLVAPVRQVAARLGVSFHLGSMCRSPGAYVQAADAWASILKSAGTQADILDFGGGFPTPYLNEPQPPLADYFAALNSVAEPSFVGAERWCEPGRAIAAPGASLVVKVVGRHGRRLYLNDGIYGGLASPGPPPPRFDLPVRRLRQAPPTLGESDFALFGPTCDGSDRLSGLFRLPDDTAEGDYLEIGQHGAYGACLRSDFNGFLESLAVTVEEAPFLPPGCDWRDLQGAT